MILKYTAACVIIFAILAFLKFVEDSPIRSWKTVFFTAIPLSFIVCYWVNCAYPPPPPPAPQVEKTAAYKAELERTFRRIEGVTSASITGSLIELDFGNDLPETKIKSIAQQAGITASYFLKVDKVNRMVIFVKVRGKDRYRMEYDTSKGIVSEEMY